MSGKNQKPGRKNVGGTAPAGRSRGRAIGNYLLAFTFGVVVTAAVAMFASNAEPNRSALSLHDLPIKDTYRSTTGGFATKEPSRGAAGGLRETTGKRTVSQLVALTNEQLERTDIVEMSIVVAREIPGLEKLNYNHYRRIVDAWTDQFRRWVPTVEYAFHQAPHKYKDDINFFRLGMLAQFLDQRVGIAYVEEQKQAQIEARKTGKQTGVRYTDPGQLLLHGLIDTKRGTCATMPVLHVAIGRRLGWPVGLACASWHYICRYDDGKVVYNIETTDTGRGIFAEGSDEDYVRKQGVSRKAIACGSDLRKLSAREMLAVFVISRGRYLADTGKRQAAARDFALAHTLFPNNRKAYIQLTTNLIATGETLFAPGEDGHPAWLAAWLAGRYQPPVTYRRRGSPRPSRRQRAPLAEIEQINATNRRNMRQMIHPPTPAAPYRPSPNARQPGVPQPYQPPMPRRHPRPNSYQ